MLQKLKQTKNIMKKLLSVLVLTTLLFSCSAEERLGETDCDCIERRQYAIALPGEQNAPSTQWISTDQTRILPYDVGCSSNGITRDYSDDCTPQSHIIPAGYCINYRWIVECN